MAKRLLPEYEVNGWRIEKRPNSFAERWIYEASSLTPDGYVAAVRGFNTLRDARQFCGSSPAPTKRQSPVRLN